MDYKFGMSEQYWWDYEKALTKKVDKLSNLLTLDNKTRKTVHHLIRTINTSKIAKNEIDELEFMPRRVRVLLSGVIENGTRAEKELQVIIDSNKQN